MPLKNEEKWIRASPQKAGTPGLTNILLYVPSFPFFSLSSFFFSFLFLFYFFVFIHVSEDVEDPKLLSNEPSFLSTSLSSSSSSSSSSSPAAHFSSSILCVFVVNYLIF